MKIVLTNDDGIFSEGIYAIYAALKKIGNVTVVAPDRERSSISHSITLTRPLWKQEVERYGKPFGTALSGTPADCVKYAVKCLLKRSPDLVVSGINPGPNDGCSVFYSGTVGGAREGALLGAQAVALSVNAFQEVDFSSAVIHGINVIKFLLKNPLPRGSFLNVNVPHKSLKEIKGVKITQQGMSPIKGKFFERINPYGAKYLWMSGVMPPKGKNLSRDTNALLDNYVTITPLHCDQTDYNVLKLLEARQNVF
jgi:5'-nucleotidase